MRRAAAGDVPDDDAWLGPRERAVLAGLHVAKRRADWRLGRWAAKRALLGTAAVGPGAVDPAAVELLAAPDGAPEAWVGGERLAVTVSWSHRAGRAVAAVAGPGVVVGVDLEVLEPRSAAFLAEWFSAAERAWVGDDVVLRANLLWTAKEAAAKVRREGLRLDVRSLVVTVPGAPEAPASAAGARAEWAPVSVAEPASVGAGPLRGWWSCTDGSVVTVLTDPPTDPPTG